jgi:hypothetical protein
MASTERKYYVKSNWWFNLDSMNTKIYCLIDDIQEGKYEYIWLMGKKMGIKELISFQLEIHDLMKYQGYKVTGKQYGRIKAISDERNMMRYATCLAKGMNEEDAGYAFMD